MSDIGSRLSRAASLFNASYPSSVLDGAEDGSSAGPSMMMSARRGPEPEPAGIEDMTVEDAKAFLTEHPEALAEAREQEEQSKNRSTLLTWIDEQLAGEPTAPEGDLS